MHINGSVIKSRREEYNLTQSQVSIKTGVSKSSISRLENDTSIDFIDVIRILKLLDLNLDELIIAEASSTDTKVLDDLDIIRENRTFHLLEKTLKRLTMQEWRSTRIHSVYYDWHTALMFQYSRDYQTALVFIDKTLERLELLPSLEHLRVSVYTAKGYVLHMMGRDGNEFYKAAIYSTRVGEDKIGYRTRVRLLSYMMDGNIKMRNYDNVKRYGERALYLLKENESTYMKKRISKLCEEVKQSPIYGS